MRDIVHHLKHIQKKIIKSARREEAKNAEFSNETVGKLVEKKRSRRSSRMSPTGYIVH